MLQAVRARLSTGDTLARAKADDAAEFAELVRDHQSIVFSLARHFTHDREAAEDLAQDVFLELFRSIQRVAELPPMSRAIVVLPRATFSQGAIMMRQVRRAVVVLLAVWALPSAVAGQDAQLRLDHLARLAPQAQENVDLTIPPDVLQLAIAFIPADDPNQAEIKELISKLEGVYVKSLRFDRAGVYSADDLDAIRNQLTGWSQIVNIQEAEESIGVYVLQQNGQTNGLAVVVAQPRELTVVNIVGPIDLAKLASIAGKFGIPQLPIPDGAR